MIKRITALLAFLLLFLNSASYSWAETNRYVTDDLTIPMRSGTTTSHKILKFLKSGTKVVIKETTEDGLYSWIMLADDNNKLGWVESEHLQDQAVARDRIISINKNISSVREKNATLKNELSELKQQYKELEKARTQLDKEKQQLNISMNQLRKSASRPIETAEKNIQLQKTIIEQKKSNDSLLREVAILSDESIKEWFLIGGGVAIGSLILGLLLTRISWRKKGSWGGEGF